MQRTARVIHLPSTTLPVELLAQLDGDGKLGIENVKKITTVVVTFTVDLLKALKTKSYLDLLRIVPALLLQGNIIAFAPLAWDEIQDTSLKESNDLSQHFNTVLELDNKDTEAVIEQAFQFVPKVYALVTRMLSIVTDARTLYTEFMELVGAGNEEEDTKVIDLAMAANTEALVAKSIAA